MILISITRHLEKSDAWSGMVHCFHPRRRGKTSHDSIFKFSVIQKTYNAEVTRNQENE